MKRHIHTISDYDLVLDAKFGKEGTPERAKAEEDAYSFYSQVRGGRPTNDGRASGV